MGGGGGGVGVVGVQGHILLFQIILFVWQQNDFFYSVMKKNLWMSVRF